MATLFVHGFSPWLRKYSNDPAKLVTAFTPAIQPNAFLVAVAPDNQILAMVGCPDGLPSLVLDRDAFIGALGITRGRIAFRALHKFLIETHYPFPVTPGMGSIEFVVSRPGARGLGITRRLIEYTMQHRRFTTYVLEVTSTNTRAIRLYESLGFSEILRKPAHERSGVSEYLYLQHRA